MPAEDLSDYASQVRLLTPGEQREAALIARGLKPRAVDTADKDFTLGPGQVRYDAQGNEVARGGSTKPQVIKGADGFNYNALTGERILPNVQAPPPEQDLTAQSGLRKEWMALNKDFVALRDSFTKIQGAAVDPSPAGDLALIFNYMKMLDPGSVVREGEFATAQNAAGVDARIRNVYNQVIDGTRLNSDQRADFTNVAKRIYGDQLGIYNQNLDRYRGIAQAGGLDVNSTVPDITLAPEVDLPSAGSQTGGVPVGHRVTTAEGRVMEKGADGQWFEVTP